QPTSSAASDVYKRQGFITSYNPNFSAVILPWTVPKFIAAFFTMGWQGVVVRIVIMIVLVALYYPFFKYLDKEEVANEERLISE
ncbi:hypothetical protein KQJ29_32820, partial [Enterococcus sp. S181_ASV_20]|nr:hypothetical protein [Enterococcus sp. S181_ASV_20]